MPARYISISTRIHDFYRCCLARVPDAVGLAPKPGYQPGEILANLDEAYPQEPGLHLAPPPWAPPDYTPVPPPHNPPPPENCQLGQSPAGFYVPSRALQRSPRSRP